MNVRQHLIEIAHAFSINGVATVTFSGAILAGIMLLAGCASEPVPDSDTNPVPPERITAPQYLEAAPGTAP
jgi:hypothetical protein